LPVYNDPVREAEQREERIKLAWHRSGHGGVYAARQAVDEAAAVHENAVEAYRRTMLRVMTTRNALSNASDQVMGERADRLAQLRVAQGIADVAKFRMEQAGIDLDNAIKELREATAVIP
jgi:exonuclease VII small subunit